MSTDPAAHTRGEVGAFYAGKHGDYGFAPGADNAHARILERIGSGHDILEIGCGPGHLGAAMRALGNRVIGVEVAANAAAAARERLDGVIEGGIEDPGLRLPAAASFDVIVCADVLEHLFDPAAALTRLLPLLRTGGRLIASLPNVAHFTVRLGLLAGRFEYTDIGILDRGHLRFFTGESAMRLLESAGLEVIDRSFATSVPNATPGVRRVIDLCRRLPAGVRDKLAPLIAVQFVLVARRG